MSGTETVATESAPSYPLAELNREAVTSNEDQEWSSHQEIPTGEAVERELSTPLFKLIVAGYSFFCAGVNDGTCKRPLVDSL
ncbi:hypothetical protein F5Y17DRAFT_390718 [Xylariaceae sp. FL0594]|nr:hypothetical protein F5Y17DRAFT_390718 [Xylariaceae sp. FL0594]